ncbi:4Fe-4S dicluster domain-containing protein [Dissulfurirhabdus thermomarina]|uniref:4Fe-4S dicluster domain-containing protein n=1 Tax=Dissulfurirhabdus thermomarina TaxID=1765737 RepID=A0A6N9TPE6_DISTH|nr:mercury methylation ferredoxin HgcB [Dissulfurirhabdus thermomarina]NDY43039.1 4Fe-4S dicluster domain-containing protein [Dissulfurirhabdus thermomarina]NMX22731.1 4Fe-4S binding protein [Dissulfurirhabdus thermomarina]
MEMRYLEGVATLALDEAACIGCGRCTEVCPHAVFEVAHRKARIRDRDRCMECGACARNCPAGALRVQAGVGCAAAIVMGWLTGRTPACGCGSDGCC